MRRREILGWCMYDFANSGYAASVQVVVYATYFASVVVPAGGADIGPLRGVRGEALWGWAVGLSMLIVALAVPVLGAVADYSGAKKRFLMVLCWLGCVATSAMVFVGPGDYVLGIVLLLAANFGMAGGNAFYNAFLPQIAPPERQGRVSGWGWGLGYLGSALCLVLNLAMIKSPATFGLTEAGHLHVRVALFTVGVWWAVFSIPTFVWVRERPGAAPADGANALRAGLERLVDTFTHLRRYGQAMRLLGAFFIYNDGVQTVIAVSAIFATSALGLESGDVILIFLTIQLVALPGTLVTGWLADRFGHKRLLLVLLAVWSVAVLAAYFVQTKAQYWALCLAIGFVLGGVQAASRSFFSRLIPADRAAEFFGFYALVGKFASILGPIIFGVVAHVTGSVRAAVFWLLPMFLVGMGLLALVREPRAEAHG